MKPAAAKPLPDMFDDSIGFDDPRPYPQWQPNARQIFEWGARIREEREAEEIRLRLENKKKGPADED